MTKPTPAASPSEMPVPTGRAAGLVSYLRALAAAAALPSFRQLADWTSESGSRGGVSRPTVQAVFRVGSHDSAARPTWASTRLVVEALVRHLPPDTKVDILSEPEVEALWQRAVGMVAKEVQVVREYQELFTPVPNTAEHFAQVTMAWASRTLRSGSRKRDHLADGPQYCASLSLKDVDPRAAKRAFDINLLNGLDRLGDQYIHGPDAIASSFWFTPTSSAMFGITERGGRVSSIIAIEISAFGAVTVYERVNPTMAETIDELSEWLRRAFHMCFQVVDLLGWGGMADGASLVDFASHEELRGVRTYGDEGYGAPVDGDMKSKSHPYLPTNTRFIPTHFRNVDCPSTFGLKYLPQRNVGAAASSEMADRAREHWRYELDRKRSTTAQFGAYFDRDGGVVDS